MYITKKSSDVSSEVSTQPTSTQIKPTFSRQDLMSKLNPNSNVAPERQKLANYVQNSFYNQLSKNGIPENIAFSTSVLFSNLAKKSTVDVEKFKQWFDKTYITTEDLPAKMKQGLFQSAMYKSPKENFSDFYNQVFEKEKDAKENNTSLKKSYFEYNDENTNIRVPHDTIVHDNNKHNLSSSVWEILFNNLTNPSSAVLSNKPRFDGTPVLLKYNIANKSYGVVVEFF